MFDFIGNAVRNFVNDVQWEMTDRSLKKAEKEFDEWDEKYRARCAEINALDMGSKEARQWCIKNHDIPLDVEKKIKDMFSWKEIIYNNCWGEAYAGMSDALAAFRSIVLNDEEGFITWPKEDRIVETSIRFFFGKKRYDSYNDFTDDEVPPLSSLTNFGNGYNAWVCNEMLEEAFRRVQGDEPMFRLEVDIEKNTFSIKPVKDEI